MPKENLDLFEYKIGKDYKVFIYYSNKLLLTYTKKKATSFLNKIKPLCFEDQQMMMAKLTGNFKRGNEKLAKSQFKNRQ